MGTMKRRRGGGGECGGSGDGTCSGRSRRRGSVGIGAVGSLPGLLLGLLNLPGLLGLLGLLPRRLAVLWVLPRPQSLLRLLIVILRLPRRIKGS